MSTVRREFDETMLDWFEAEGMRPALQARSRELVIRLFNEGLAILEFSDFENLSIETLCERCEVTVGAFYSRFENKEAFIDALQRLVVAVTSRNIIADYETGLAPKHDVGELLSWITRGSVAWFRRFDGLIRASLRRANGERNMWTPMRELGGLQISLALPLILELLPADKTSATEQRCRFAFQMLYGTLNNMVLINPGPFSIQDKGTARMLAAAVVRLLDPSLRYGEASDASKRKATRRVIQRV